MNKILQEAFPLYMAVFMPMTAMACTSCSEENEDNMSYNNQTATGSVSTDQEENRTFNVNGVDFKMIFVGHGTFTMGSNNTNVQFSESPAHQVTLTKDYLIGETEVTEALWNAMMGNGGGSASMPKTSVTWSNAHTFIDRLNEIARAKGLIADNERFRLPTEAQWEFAAKGGNKSRGYLYSGSDNVNDVAVTRENSGSDAPIRVKSKQPNELGIYDMSGNAYEWVDDRGGNYPSTPQTDPQNTSGSGYVKRGGSNYHPFRSESYLFTNTGRYFYSSTDWTIGFRIALEIDGSSAAVSSVEADNNNLAQAIYDIHGRKLTAMTNPGFYIVNGKKIYKR